MSDLGNDMVVCPQCQTEIEASARACPNCGRAPEIPGGDDAVFADNPGALPADDVFSDSPEHFEELGDTDPSTGAEDQKRQRRLMIGGAVGLGLVSLVILGLGAWFLFGPNIPFLGAKPELTQAPGSVTATPASVPATKPPTVVSTEVASEPATAVPTMVPVQVQVEGPSTFADASYPYKAFYDVTLKRGDVQEAVLRCDGCLTAGEARTSAQLERGVPTRFDVVAPPLQEIELALYVGGAECTTWKLAPSSEPATLQLACSPRPVQ